MTLPRLFYNLHEIWYKDFLIFPNVKYTIKGLLAAIKGIPKNVTQTFKTIPAFSARQYFWIKPSYRGDYFEEDSAHLHAYTQAPKSSPTTEGLIVCYVNSAPWDFVTQGLYVNLTQFGKK